MAVLIENLQKSIEITDNIDMLLNQAVELSLKTEDFKIPSEVSILLVSNEEIKEMNKEHRGVDKATDVLSFPMIEMHEGEMKSSEGDFDLDENLLLLGDIVVSMEMAKKQSEEYGHSFERELAFLVVHGVYHLLGYDHEDCNEEKRMMEKQEAILMQMGLYRHEE